MSNPIETRNERLAQKLIRQLQRRHFEAYYCRTTEEIHAQIRVLMPEGSSVTWGGTTTVRSLGIPQMLKDAGYEVWDRDEAQTAEEKLDIYRKAFTADFYLSSANALSEDGVIVNIDGTGNRVAAITWGPKKVIFVIGLNKVAQDVTAALQRARSTASPINAARFDIKTPCQADGTCHNCNSPQSICNYIHFTRNSFPAGRHIVILTDQNLGY